MAETSLEFITLRQPQRIRQRVKRLRYIRDLRDDAAAPLRTQFEAAKIYRQKVALAFGIVSSPVFFTTDLYYASKYEAAAEVLRTSLIGPVTQRDGTIVNGAELAVVIAALEARVPLLAQSQFFHDPNLAPGAVAALFVNYAVIWNSLYAVTVLAGLQQVETNYVIDSIRVMHLLAVLRRENLRATPPAHWPYYDFSAYEAAIRPAIVEYDRVL